MNGKSFAYNAYHDMSRDDLIEELIKCKQKKFLDATFEENFSSLFMYSPIITFIVSLSDHRIIAVNDLFLKTFALSYRDVVGNKLQSLKIWPAYSTLENFFADMAAPTLFPKEYTLLKSSAKTLDLQISAMHYTKDHENFIIIWGNDITKLTESKKQLMETNRNFTNILENSPTFVSRFDRNLTCAYVNKAVEKLTGRRADSLIGKTIAAMNFPNSFCALWTSNLMTVFESKKSVAFASKYRSALGKESFYQARLVPELNKQHEVEYVLCTTYDITALKHVESYLRMHQARYAWYLNTIPDILFKYDIDGNYLDSSGTKKELFGLTKNDYIGKNVRDILPLNIAEKIVATIHLVYATHTIQTFEYSMIINGISYQFEARITSIPHTKEFLLTLRDITELKELRTKVERLNRLQLVGEVASTIGHEIRNPLTTVCGFLQFMRSKEEYQSWNEQFNLMLNELEHSNNIISKFLALTHDKSPLSERQCLDELIAELKA